MKILDSGIDLIELQKEIQDAKLNNDRDKLDKLLFLIKDIELPNLYTKHEVNDMIAQVIKDVFIEHKQDQEKQRQEHKQDQEKQRQEFKQDQEKQRQEFKQENIAGRRWIITTIIGCTIALAGLIHLTH